MCVLRTPNLLGEKPTSVNSFLPTIRRTGKWGAEETLHERTSVIEARPVAGPPPREGAPDDETTEDTGVPEEGPTPVRRPDTDEEGNTRSVVTRAGGCLGVPGPARVPQVPTRLGHGLLATPRWTGRTEWKRQSGSDRGRGR